MPEFEVAAKTAEVGPGEMKEAEINGNPILVANVDQRYYAVDARCPNEGTNLAQEGRLDHEHLTCPYDHWTYDIRNGERVDPPNGPGLRSYAIRVDQNTVLVGPPRDGGA